MNPQDMLRTVDTVLVIDWPTKEVPETLALAGFHVFVHGGPGPEDYSIYELKDGEVVSRHVGHPPDRADLVYSYRPFNELYGIIATAKNLQAKTIWTQSGMSAFGISDPKGCWLSEEDLRLAQNLVQSAGLNHVTEPFIADVAREVRIAR